MPDDRFFHKRLGHSEKVTTLNDFQYRVWTQYVLSADDCGVMRGSALAFQADNDALARRTPRAVQQAIDRLVAIDLIQTFTHQGQLFIYQRTWQNFQRVRFPRPTIQPSPPADDLAACSPQTRDLFALRHGATTEPHPIQNGESSAPALSPAGAGGHERLTANGKRLTAALERESEGKPTGRSKHPIFTGQRFTVFDWQLDKLMQMLGPHTEAFHLDEWFDALDAQAVKSGQVIPQRDGGAWLLAQTTAEAQRRGLPMAVTQTTHSSKTAGNVAALQRFADRGRS